MYPDDRVQDVRVLGVALEMVHEASQRLVRAVDGMTDDAWSAPSLLPGWSRAHVVAHLALNAEALTGVVDGVREGRPVPMYPSQEARDGDIAQLAGADPSEVRARLLGSTTRMAEALGDLPPDLADVRVERVPGGPTLVVGDVAAMRWREVEIHLVDLDVGPTRASWTPDFCRALLDAMAARQSGSCVVVPTDLPGRWPVGVVGGGGPTVNGSAADLGWWLSGRGSGDGLTSEAGVLPEMGSI